MSRAGERRGSAQHGMEGMAARNIDSHGPGDLQRLVCLNPLNNTTNYELKLARFL